MFLPKPVAVEYGEGQFVLDDSTTLAAPAELAGVGRWLRTALGLSLPPSSSGVSGGITVELSADLGPEEYRLSVRADGVHLIGGDAAGAFYGAQTVRQLLPPAAHRAARISAEPWHLPAVTVDDRPRFAWRGCMLDVARHFLPKREVLRYIDLIAAHKLNVLHLHLTDDQGWRVEIKRYPRLTEIGGWRRESMVGHRAHEQFDGRPHGGFYTQDDIREIVAYATERFVTVVPEIDLPGHTQAAIAAYPELGNATEPIEVGNRWGLPAFVLNVEDATIEFFRNVFDEVLELFPGRYIGVGGDECSKTEWKASARVQRRMRELGVADEDELQSWVIRQFDDWFTKRGRVLFGWDEILEGGLAPGATVASWRGMAGAVAAARAGHDVVTCPYGSVYLDYRQSDRADEPIPVGSVTTLEDVYGFEPVPESLTAEEARHVLGAQANVWTEFMDSPRVVDYMAFPRLSAFAEVVWSPAGRDFEEFRIRLEEHLRRLDALGVEYRPPAGPRPWQTRPDAGGSPM